MARAKEGERVFAVLGANKETVHMFGFGTYEGQCEPDIELMGIEPGAIPGFTNPKIKLDNGDVVWGAECWWGPEDKFAEFQGARKVVNVDIKECRQ